MDWKRDITSIAKLRCQANLSGVAKEVLSGYVNDVVESWSEEAKRLCAVQKTSTISRRNAEAILKLAIKDPALLKVAQNAANKACLDFEKKSAQTHERKDEDDGEDEDEGDGIGIVDESPAEVQELLATMKALRLNYIGNRDNSKLFFDSLPPKLDALATGLLDQAEHMALISLTLAKVLASLKNRDNDIGVVDLFMNYLGSGVSQDKYMFLHAQDIGSEVDTVDMKLLFKGTLPSHDFKRIYIPLFSKNHPRGFAVLKRLMNKDKFDLSFANFEASGIDPKVKAFVSNIVDRWVDMEPEYTMYVHENPKNIVDISKYNDRFKLNDLKDASLYLMKGIQAHALLSRVELEPRYIAALRKHLALDMAYYLVTD